MNITVPPQDDVPENIYPRRRLSEGPEDILRSRLVCFVLIVVAGTEILLVSDYFYDSNLIYRKLLKMCNRLCTVCKA